MTLVFMKRNHCAWDPFEIFFDKKRHLSGKNSKLSCIQSRPKKVRFGCINLPLDILLHIQLWDLAYTRLQNLQVVKLVDSEHVNENIIQNSSSTCKHNLFALIQSKKMFFKCQSMWESSKRLRESELPCV